VAGFESGKQARNLKNYDSIIIGAGHNGLVCASYLARAGQRVLLLEASGRVGGLAEAREFHPGFRASVAHSVGHFSNKVANELGLAVHGYEPRAVRTVGLAADGRHVTVENRALSGAEHRDHEAYLEYDRLLRKLAGVLEPFWLKSVPDIGGRSFGDLMTFAQVGINLRRLGRKDMREFLRVASLPARDLMDEYFDSALVKAMLSWDGLIGSRMAPRSPNSAVLAMLYRLSGEAGEVTSLIDALHAAATSVGVEVRCGTAVDKIIVDGGDDGLIAKGVRLHGGEELSAERVISSADPKTTFLHLVGVRHLDIGFTNRIRRLRCNGYVAKLHLALDGAPEFSGLDSANGRLIIAPEMDAIEFAYDDAKYGECSASPVIEISLPSLRNSALAPAGKHVLSAHVMFVPYKHKGGWTAAARQAACDRAIDTITQYAPGLRDQILRSEFLTPADLESEYRVTGGHWHHAEFAMDQMLMMRPTYGAAQYRTPIPGLWLCGAGCHPGGDIVGAAGHNAAREILR